MPSGYHHSFVLGLRPEINHIICLSKYSWTVLSLCPIVSLVSKTLIDFLAPVGFLRREVDLGQHFPDSRPIGKGWTTRQ